MTLYDKLPDRVTYKWKEYLLDLSFRKVLAVADLMEEPLPDEVKLRVSLELLVKGKHPVEAGLLSAVMDVITLDRPKRKPKQKVIDLQKDWQYIYAGFQQAYGINLFRDDLHYLEFLALLNSLPGNTRMSQIIDIRTKPIPKANKYNQAEIARLTELKAEFALSEPGDFQRGLNRLFDALKSQIGRG